MGKLYQWKESGPEVATVFHNDDEEGHNAAEAPEEHEPVIYATR